MVVVIVVVVGVLLDGRALWPCSVAVLGGRARWPCSVAVLGGRARWPCSVVMLGVILGCRALWPCSVGTLTCLSCWETTGPKVKQRNEKKFDWRYLYQRVDLSGGDPINI